MIKSSSLRMAMPGIDPASSSQPNALRNNQRAADRYRAKGSVVLKNGDKILQGNIYDLSMNGLSMMVEFMPSFKISSATHWLCHINSKDLPCPVEFIARVVRQRKWNNGAELGCQIVLIDHKPLRALSAFRTLSKLRKRN